MRNCTILAFDGCSCTPGECRSRAIDLGRFQKRTEPPFPPCSRIAFAFVAWFAVSAAFLITINELRDMDRRHEIAGRV
ncbi:hypothetical protein QTA58_22855 [Neorhizobium sp. CSC1952]|uniref:hypothetical protein n=1 Tax=Neorhizobium sp. CSC1952 TaxID=2978974 RepID=UPI0025A51F19|nr:hypothetical protein [Rhizobium sp. CSC1952]WJR66993.1 hypothetical protein QTA58_22855 [Rhizobium sp. CSC1952]